MIQGIQHAWRKRDLVDAINRWDGPNNDWPIAWEKCKTKAHMLDEAKRLHPGFKYVVQELADKFSHTNFDIKFLFLPVAHPELNPMELVWGVLKRSVATANLNFVLSEVEQLTREKTQAYDQTTFEPFVNHIVQQEREYRRVAPIFDQLDDIRAPVDSESETDSVGSLETFEYIVSESEVERLTSEI